MLSQPQPPERVEGKPTFQVLSACACNKDHPAHPGHLTARCNEHAVGVLLVQPSNVLGQRGVDFREVDEVSQGHHEHAKIVRPRAARTCLPQLTLAARLAIANCNSHSADGANFPELQFGGVRAGTAGDSSSGIGRTDMTTDVTPFRLQIPHTQIDDLHDRLTRTRWPSELPAVGWQRGVPRTYLQGLANYWASDYDWRTHEARLNEFA